MDKFLQTKKGLEYLLETSPSDMPVVDAIAKARQDFEDANNEYQRQIEEEKGGWL
jgi:hypothetical protein